MVILGGGGGWGLSSVPCTGAVDSAPTVYPMIITNFYRAAIVSKRRKGSSTMKLAEK